MAKLTGSILDISHQSDDTSAFSRETSNFHCFSEENQDKLRSDGKCQQSTRSKNGKMAHFIRLAFLPLRGVESKDNYVISILYFARARARARARVDGRSPAPPEQGGGAPPLPVYAKFWKPGRAAACCCANFNTLRHLLRARKKTRKTCCMTFKKSVRKKSRAEKSRAEFCFKSFL